MAYLTRNKNGDNYQNQYENLVNLIDTSMINKKPDLILIKTFFEQILGSNAANCLSISYNNKNIKLHKLIETINDNDIVIESNYYAQFLPYIDEKICLKIIKNQTLLNTDYCDKLYFDKNIKNSYSNYLNFV